MKLCWVDKHDSQFPTDVSALAFSPLAFPTIGCREVAVMQFKYKGGGLGKGGTLSLYMNGVRADEDEIEATAPMVFSADDGCDIGRDTGAPVAQDYGPRGNAFTGRVKGVQIAIAETAEAEGHWIAPQKAVRIAMARQ
jgi:hypothetical protein